ncbi:NADH-quinone oxidoreductase subunit L [Methyloglobulus morosus KoM1]|uniref:NADH-quinone oxidoreductase subunit L n=1 Tax=Methyloglobulus morosus KoM1 TaxID=1116472 RepID=V5BUC8_9GAMM|nr:proton-conducting transporter membrane subunit [Methyloglobulus morosus]ESS71484.1 NADH-quinone oxidoreductase subunit L [Methyloglobulus morosus KoM1]
MDALVILIPLMPLFAAFVIGIAHLFGALKGEASETFTALTATWAISMSCLLALVLLGADFLHRNGDAFTVGLWLDSDALKIDLAFMTTGFNVKLAALFAVLLMVITRFSINYMHREAGYHRFFFILSLFSSAMFLLILSGNAIGTFVGWELAGLCSYLLIAYAYDRPVAVANATRVFVTNRVGDAGFILGIGLSFAWIESLNWTDINAAAAELSKGEAAVIGLCFTVAALAKSAQLPFSPWLARAMEGPTPSSAAFYGAVMIHAGVFLIIMLAPLISQTPLVRGALIFSGTTTALYSYFVGLTQTDVKSSLVFATTAQLGLMFLECGLDFWQLASWHLCAHAVVRCYLVLTAPSLMFNVKDNPIKPVSPMLGNKRWLFVASLQRFWVEQITDWALVKPVRHLARDLSYFDDNIVDRLMGVPAPAISAASSLAQLEERAFGAKLENGSDNFVAGTGLIGELASSTAGLVHWFEDRLVLQGVSKDALHVGREMGHLANKFETLVLRPRYLVLLVFITLLVAF